MNDLAKVRALLDLLPRDTDEIAGRYTLVRRMRTTARFDMQACVLGRTFVAPVVMAMTRGQTITRMPPSASRSRAPWRGYP